MHYNYAELDLCVDCEKEHCEAFKKQTLGNIAVVKSLEKSHEE